MYMYDEKDNLTREAPVFQFLEAYAPLFYFRHRYFLISGGRAGGKTYNTVAYCIYKLFSSDEYVRIVIARYTQRSIKSSIYRDILDLLEKFGLMGFVRFEGEDIVNIQNGNRIMTHSFKMTDKAAVAKSKGIANPTMLIVDEAQEIPNEEAFVQLNDSFRNTQGHTQIILLFNPESKAHWIYKRWYLNGRPNPIWLDDHCFIHTTYKDNPYIDPLKVKEWERMRDIDPKYYSKHIMGDWQEIAEGQIFDNWQVGWEPDPEAKRVIGIDFGFSNDPTAIIDARLHNNKLWVRELFYGKSMTNQDLADILINAGITRSDTIIADSAEPKSIEELRRAGFTVRPAVKGPDSVRSGISKLLSKQVYVEAKSKNIWNEYENYRWVAGTNRPIDEWNHGMDAIRYALSGETSGQYVLMR
jgi:phage terminase large subunit